MSSEGTVRAASAKMRFGEGFESVSATGKRLKWQQKLYRNTDAACPPREKSTGLEEPPGRFGTCFWAVRSALRGASQG